MTAVTQRLEALIKAQAYGLGFDLVGIATLGPAETAAAFDEWLAAGRDGEMAYLARGAEKRRDTRRPFEGAKSAIVVGMDYGGREPSGPVARYARPSTGRWRCRFGSHTSFASPATRGLR